MSPASMKRFRLLRSARIDGEIQGAGYVFTRADGDPMPERVDVLAPDHVGPDDRFEMALKCSPLFEEIDDHVHGESSVPLMATMPAAASRMEDS
jgi:hypothetical protein